VLFSGMRRSVVWYKFTDVSEESTAEALLAVCFFLSLLSYLKYVV
jgi:hypothetical protein